MIQSLRQSATEAKVPWLVSTCTTLLDPNEQPNFAASVHFLKQLGFETPVAGGLVKSASDLANPLIEGTM